MPDTDDTAASVRTPDVGGEVTAQDVFDWAADTPYETEVERVIADAVNERIRQAREQGRADGLREAADQVEYRMPYVSERLRRMADEVTGP